MATIDCVTAVIAMAMAISKDGRGIDSDTTIARRDHNDRSGIGPNEMGGVRTIPTRARRGGIASQYSPLIGPRSLLRGPISLF